MSSNKTPFELRFEIFNQAKNMLSDKYYSEREDALSKYHSEVDSGKKPDFPEMPSYPTFDEVKDMAQLINTFVSSKGHGVLY
tara:strand:+ start:323 stop:568 length:246 start_codon:yes stop_codon:yes gene_type:complete